MILLIFELFVPTTGAGLELVALTLLYLPGSLSMTVYWETTCQDRGSAFDRRTLISARATRHGWTAT